MTNEEMQAALEAGDLPGTPSEARAIEKAYALGIGAAIEVLRDIEWSNEHWSYDRQGGGCPVCANSKQQGHAVDCKLAAALHHGDD